MCIYIYTLLIHLYIYINTNGCRSAQTAECTLQFHSFSCWYAPLRAGIPAGSLQSRTDTVARVTPCIQEQTQARTHLQMGRPETHVFVFIYVYTYIYIHTHMYLNIPIQIYVYRYTTSGQQQRSHASNTQQIQQLRNATVTLGSLPKRPRHSQRPHRSVTSCSVPQSWQRSAQLSPASLRR